MAFADAIPDSRGMRDDIRISAISDLLRQLPPPPQKSPRPAPDMKPKQTKKPKRTDPFLSSDSESEARSNNPTDSGASSSSMVNGKRHNTGPPSGVTQSVHKSSRLEADEQVDQNGWVTKGGRTSLGESGNGWKGKARSNWNGSTDKKPDWDQNPVKALNGFRVNIGLLR